MAMMGPTQRGGGSGRSGRRSQPMSEINVTPFVDVMLVLLIVFMVAATTLYETTGVAIDLPKTDAKALPVSEDPLLITVNADGEVFLQKDQVTLDTVVPRLEAIAANGYDERIHLRADEGADYGAVMKVMSRINKAGFSNLNLVTDPEDP